LEVICVYFESMFSVFVIFLGEALASSLIIL